MANIRIELDHTIVDGETLTFKAPVACSSITGINVYYPDENGTIASKALTFRDAHKNNLADLDDLFTEGAIVKVIVDVVGAYAYIQNADTNKYLEDKISEAQKTADGKAAASHKHAVSDIKSGTLPVANGGTGVTSLAELAAALGVIGMAKLAVVSYAGTGKYGSSNPCSIILPFVPKYFWITHYKDNSTGAIQDLTSVKDTSTVPKHISRFVDCTKLTASFPSSSTSSSDGNGLGAFGSASSISYSCRNKLSGTTLSWFATAYSRTSKTYENSAEEQYNVSGRTYFGIAVG